MYRLVRWCLAFLWCAGLFWSFLGVVPFGPIKLIISLAVIFTSCVAINRLFEVLFKAPSNTESTYITALILSLVMGPEASWSGFLFLILISALAIASKYILAINKKHVFNPAAFSMVAGAYLFGYYPGWWIGNMYMAPLVLIAGFLLVRKIQRFDLVVSFFVIFFVTSSQNILSIQNFTFFFRELFAYSPVLFFALVMLTEPATTPPTRNMRIIYGASVAFLLAPFVHFGSIYFSPELALLAGNIFSFLVSPKIKLAAVLKEKINIANNTYDFVFSYEKPLRYRPGQYMEWTLKHKKGDARGMRRYFTLASSPTEHELRMGVKFYPNPSSYKKALAALVPGDTVVASQLAGDFVLPYDKNKKLVFLAGGIGITPFRSMVKYLLDKNEKRDVVIFYANNTYEDIAYRDIFDQAKTQFGTTTVYAVNSLEHAPLDFNCKEGIINKEIIKTYAPDFKERMYYISGPRAMIVSFEKILKEMGIPKRHVKTDFFPGYA